VDGFLGFASEMSVFVLFCFVFSSLVVVLVSVLALVSIPVLEHNIEVVWLVASPWQLPNMLLKMR
jgi:hypothetical protein